MARPLAISAAFKRIVARARPQPVVVETARCTGHCCRAFVIPAIHRVGGLRHWKLLVRVRDPRFDSDDARFIADMLIDLDREATVDPLTQWPLGEPHALYGCRHYDAAAGNCTVYDRRPLMCSGFPYDNQPDGCKAEGCTRVCVRRPGKPAPVIRFDGVADPDEMLTDLKEHVDEGLAALMGDNLTRSAGPE